ncbi:peptidoglycan-binding protein [Sphingomonas pseudosanguinis]|nr:peptidoglycan-binding protein [Sphingomonas pseudosanguinis]
MSIMQSVGESGVNNHRDVKAVQQRLKASGMSQLKVDGLAGPKTIAAIRSFQQSRLRMSRPDGRVDPKGRTWTALSGGDTGGAAAPRRRAAPVSGRQPPVASTSPGATRAANAQGNLSGAAWWHANQARYPNSQSVDDLESPFREKAKRFIAALRAAGANVRVSATRRNRIRAHLMHYSWRVAKGQIAPTDVSAIDGCDIQWDHGDLTKSRAAAAEMVRLFHIVFKPSLTSNHIAGTAIDMTISFSGTITVADGSGKSVRVGSVAALNPVGASYGVLKLASDPPHWSANGH